MECSACGFANPEGAVVCRSCAGSLSRSCLACGRANPGEFSFCGYCGASLLIPPPDSSPPATAVPPMGVRRQITVVFCDLVNSTALAEEMDPEELHEVMQAYHVACGALIAREGGYVAQHLGDGTMSYFGWPVALEHGAAAAVRAGLEVLESVKELNQRFCSRIRGELGVRVGIHTGEVVVGEVGVGGRAEQLALGTVPNVAARLQSMAEPKTVLVSEDTHQLIADAFDCEALGTQSIRGLHRSMSVFRVLRERNVAADFADGIQLAAERLLGRAPELGLLSDLWRRSMRGSGQAAVLVGDAGIGKTHLVRGFLSALEPASYRLVEIRCQSHYQSSPYFPVVDHLRRELGRPLDPEVRDRVRQLLAMLEWRGDARGARSVRRGLTAQQAKERTRDALVALLLEVAERHPLIMVVEDLHWADPSTLELLDLLLRPLGDTRALLLVTHRHSFTADWPPLEHLTHLALGPLAPEHVTELITQVAGGRELPDELAQQILEKTDGVPLFVEELTKMVLESGILAEREGRLELRGPLPSLAIPATLRDSLQARLDRLAATKEVAQIGAVIGREFGYPLLRAVVDVDEATLQRALDQLAEAQLIHERGARPASTYAFRHALIHDTAYQGMVRGTRQRYHARIARALSQDFPHIAALHPEILAQHYAAAAMPLEAADEWLRAATRSLEQSAPREALVQLHEAQNCVEAAAPSPQRDAVEGRLYATMGPALVATSGYMSSEVREVYQRAHDLAAAAGDERAVFFATVGLFASHFVHGDLDEAERLARNALDAARGEDNLENAVRLVPAHAAMGCVRLETGPIRQAHEHFMRVADLYDRVVHAPLMYVTGQDFGVLSRCYDGYALWTLGYPDQAMQSMRKGLELARELEHGHSIGLALACAVALHHFRREPAEALPLLKELRAVAERGGFPHWRHHAELYGAWAESRLGDADAGLARLRRAVELMPHQVAAARQLFAGERLLAEALVDAGRPEEALPLLQETETEFWFGSETARLRGAVLARRGDADAEAEAAFHEALEIARHQEARMLELRAAVGLAQLFAARGRGAEAVALLEPLVARFDEGLDLEDLREARLLLPRLALP